MKGIASSTKIMMLPGEHRRKLVTRLHGMTPQNHGHLFTEAEVADQWPVQSRTVWSSATVQIHNYYMSTLKKEFMGSEIQYIVA